MDRTIRVVLADDHTLIRQALRTLLEAEPGVEVVAEAGDGATAAQLAADLSADVVVMDLNMPGLSGVEATRRIGAGAGRSGTRVLVVSAHADHKLLDEVLAAGATGYVVKDAAFEELVPAIRNVAAGRVFVSASLGAELPGVRRGTRHTPG